MLVKGWPLKLMILCYLRACPYRKNKEKVEYFSLTNFLNYMYTSWKTMR